MEKIYTITFKSESQFSATIAITKEEVEAIKMRMGKSCSLGFNNQLDKKWIDILIDNCEFDIHLDTDIEDIEIKEETKQPYK